MAVPSPGDAVVDEEVRKVVEGLRKITGKVANNLSFKLLGELVEQTGRVSGLSVRHLAISGMRKVGGHKGADRAGLCE